MSGGVVVIGGGVVGLAIALQSARDRHKVRLVGDAAGSASAAAAGMLAPASEALLDGASPDAAASLLLARARWGVWAARLRVELDTAGALHLAPAPELESRATAAARLGLRAERRSDGLHLPQDAVIDPGAALERLAAAAREAGVKLGRGRVETRDGRLELDGERLKGEVVIAAGWGSAALADAAPELAALAPVKGQLLRIAAAPGVGPTLRAPGAYLAPGRLGWTVGATMEPGRDNLEPDPAALARLRAAAVAVRPELASGEATAAVGVRAATPDGGPLVGRSRGGVWLATGMRRNGWLLAPLVAEAVAAYLAGSDAQTVLGGAARAWRPERVFAQERE